MEEKQDGKRNQLLKLCVICGKDPSGCNSNGLFFTKVPPVSESFLPSSALEKTLEILSATAVDNLEHGSLFDKMNVYRVLTSPQGGLCCIPCSVILHKCVETSAQILRLETYMKNLASDIFSPVQSSLPVSKYSRMCSHHKSRPSIYKTVPPPNWPNCNKYNYDIFSRFRNNTATSATEPSKPTLRRTTGTSNTSGKLRLIICKHEPG